MFFFRKKHLRIIYNSEKLSESYLSRSHDLFDVDRFVKIRAALLTDGLLARKYWIPSESVLEEDILRVHSRTYLNKLRNPPYIARALQLDYVAPWDTDLFEYFLHQTGGTLQAAKLAIGNKIVAANLGGGFHHAFPEHSRGFCLLNDVAIAIQNLRAADKNLQVLIVDLDFHQGDGVAAIFENTPEVFTFSVQAENWQKFTNENNVDLVLPEGIGDAGYLRRLEESLSAIFRKFSPDIIFYLAGADVHKDDALGNFGLSDEGVLKRDVFVYRQAKEHRVPLVILAAGGYGKKNWRLYYNFLKWILQEG